MSTDDEQERLLRDLRAPGSDAELSEEQRYRAMFRAAQPAAVPATTLRSRAPRRLFAAKAVAVAAVLAVGTGGLAAAYSGNLPSPIQTLAHHVIGAPEAPAPAPSSGPPIPGTTTPRSPAPPPSSASRSPSSRPTVHPTHQPRRQAPSPVASATATPTAAPVPATTAGSAAPQVTPTPTRTPAAVLTGVMMVGTSHRADVGAQVSFSGQLTYAGTPTSRPHVVLQQRVGHRWTPVAHGRADTHGSITLDAPPLARTSSFRLSAGHGSGAVRSAPWRVAMHPLLTAEASATKKKATIHATALGGFAGDLVTLTTPRDGHLTIVGQARLDTSGSASFLVSPGRLRTSYGLVLSPTARHTASRVGVIVRLAH